MAKDKKDLWEQCAEVGCALRATKNKTKEYLVYRAEWSVEDYYGGKNTLTTTWQPTPELAVAECRRKKGESEAPKLKNAIRYTEDLLAESETKTLILSVLYDRLRDTPRDGKNTA